MCHLLDAFPLAEISRVLLLITSEMMMEARSCWKINLEHENCASVDIDAGMAGMYRLKLKKKKKKKHEMGVE